MIKRTLQKKYAFLALLVLALVAAGLYLYNKQQLQSGIIPIDDTNENQIGQLTSDTSGLDSSNPNQTEESSPPSNTDKATSGPAVVDSNEKPLKPYGSFVGNHHPSLSGKNDVPSSMQSICQGTPGATCYIEFRKGDIVKSLPEKTLDSSGSASWDWDVKTAGFKEGSWSIVAVAKLNGLTEKTLDSLNLEVEP